MPRWLGGQVRKIRRFQRQELGDGRTLGMSRALQRVGSMPLLGRVCQYAPMAFASPLNGPAIAQPLSLC